MNVTRVATQNLDNWEIPVEYIVLHYTAADLQDTLTIFTTLDKIVSAHIVIDVDGSIYELVDCLDGKALRSRHAGPSYWNEEDYMRERFNNFSIGIELVNYNGNIFPFSDDQYTALIDVIIRLQKHFPSLKDPNRILGHEHIAGYRGKADPGLCFDWSRLFTHCFSAKKPPARYSICPAELQASLQLFKEHEPADREIRSPYWQSISIFTETAIKLINKARSEPEEIT
ncbi:MAG: N-acetylmuramoyl-L-alanine amidase [Candidatus Endonucleobacter bathymodioli]|uniref:N-acetylmuramoyl-L-alanine amidase n=1 Tax=Candidatus Endonucleibacter bathymodioli TaxID=539814 RepID=A0AA90NMR7_9GAMM|nr:N-acetylmuramoyl-L-alanine amidase [Candidatus Endonucleobacter bathymodioli]